MSLTDQLDFLQKFLHEDIYQRGDKNQVHDSLLKLGTEPSDIFKSFYYKYEGPFWEENVPFELLDITEVESFTQIARNEHNFSKHYLVLSEMSANSVLVLNALNDHVYIVDFEGGDEKLIRGELKPTWLTFYEFLQAYFVV
ncbi:SMI1/KNR4 family protein [Fictibacillus sp. 18YEL24]|uniref:SMI1/KNR4 family protein n=1 Tax=Fictibacillus sp. 18YEL24 TaxID=2745875 RepID=UPI001E55C2BF|nr:SMI1/KNR4 family protein [Fictibacillus sp. 18YEL24]